MIFTEIKLVEDEVDRCKIVYDVITFLPGWFLPNEAKFYSEEAKDAIVFAAYLETTPIGFIAIKRKRSQVAEIIAMGVICGYQHLGMGKGLMEAALTYARNENIMLVEVKTADYSDPDERYITTRQFYEKNGFIALDTIDDYWDDGTPVLIMVKYLNSVVELSTVIDEQAQISLA